MKNWLLLACLAALLPVPHAARAGSEYDGLIAAHAQANGVPVALVHRVVVRESRYRPGVVGRGGAIGLMQIKLATARGLGYTGSAAGLRDPNTNLTWAVKYLAGAYRAANGNEARAVHYYAAGYYGVTRRERPAFATGPSFASNSWPGYSSYAQAPFPGMAQYRPYRMSRRSLNAWAWVPAR
jgi:soluble lytic murein transglycosylase-like protein